MNRRSDALREVNRLENSTGEASAATDYHTGVMWSNWSAITRWAESPDTRGTRVAHVFREYAGELDPKNDEVGTLGDSGEMSGRRIEHRELHSSASPSCRRVYNTRPSGRRFTWARLWYLGVRLPLGYGSLDAAIMLRSIFLRQVDCIS